MPTTTRSGQPTDAAERPDLAGAAAVVAATARAAAGSTPSGDVPSSELLQALVLLHQTMREHEWSTRLLLNGAALRMGTVTDVVDKVNGRYTFEIGVVDDERPYQWAFTGERSEMSMAVDRVTVGDVPN